MGSDPLQDLVVAYFDHEDIDPLMRWQDGRSKVQFIMHNPESGARLAYLGLWADPDTVFWLQGEPIQKAIEDPKMLDGVLDYLLRHAKHPDMTRDQARAQLLQAHAVGLPFVSKGVEIT